MTVSWAIQHSKKARRFRGSVITRMRAGVGWDRERERVEMHKNVSQCFHAATWMFSCFMLPREWERIFSQFSHIVLLATLSRCHSNRISGSDEPSLSSHRWSERLMKKKRKEENCEFSGFALGAAYDEDEKFKAQRKLYESGQRSGSRMKEDGHGMKGRNEKPEKRASRTCLVVSSLSALSCMCLFLPNFSYVHVSELDAPHS